jgi:hypothetical protein
LAAALAGCSPAPALPDTGAKDAARVFYEGLLRQDWQQSYAALHPDSQQRYPRAEFIRLAQAYRRNVGFEPEELHIRSCDEQGTQAIAHVVLTGRTRGSKQRYNDGLLLRQSAGAWRIVLPNNFGRKTP